MASPAVSSPSTAGSPCTLAPAPPMLAIKSMNTASTMAAISPASGLATPTIVTRKEWVVPPRPKPGRKPATDTPPTKRKAQNRAAQRAFRERRAARVGELEEQLEETKEEQQKREGELRDKITRLEAEVLRFSGEVQSWRLRCDTLDRLVEYERREKEGALTELSYLRSGARTTGTDAVPLPPRRNRQKETAQIPRQQQQRYIPFDPVPGPEPSSISCNNCGPNQCVCLDEAIKITSSGCGKCSDDTHCQCLQDTIESSVLEPPSLKSLKRPISPSAEDSIEKRHHRQSSTPLTPLEIDFTAQFSSKRISDDEIMMHDSTEHLAPRPGESCGFCADGGFCVCAENAAQSAEDRENRLAPLLNEVTPPPSDTDADGGQIKLPSLQPNQMHRPVGAQAPSNSNSCVNGPGTCQQCQSDPKAGLFCRSLAAMRASSSATPEAGCCGGNANGGGCCKQPQTSQPAPPPSLSVADTYKTLSTHRAFDQATDDLSTWLGRLHPQHAGRAPMEVEAASVMGVLKLFDRRFGRG
ncbi:AP-1-like transcription factor 3 [Phlyctema vagabunda]|uniref:AP-1-like transcription factor 3 n=1 Tax=Phlyctema vagabunda TaxID=108571 RepID=A0ABR4PII3_9HELO